MNKYNIHSDFKSLTIKPILSPLLLPMMNKLVKNMIDKVDVGDNILKVKKEIKGYKDGTIEITIFEPKDAKENLPCLIYYHGGAFVLNAAPYHINLICNYALKIQCKVVFVEYRLAPKYPFPYAVEDSYLAVEWVYNNAKDLKIDKNKIAIAGDSAGGTIASAVCLMARDKSEFNICGLMLIYPATDARQLTESIKNYTDTPMWDSKLNEKMWKLYLKDGTFDKREYASPIEAKSLENLPPTYMEVAEFDCLRDEGINFANELKKSNVKLELYKIEGAVHGFDIVEESEIVKTSVKRRIEFLKKVFS